MDETLQWGNLKSRVNQGDPARLATSRAFTRGAWRGRAEAAVTDPGDPEGLSGGRPVGLEKAAGPWWPYREEAGDQQELHSPPLISLACFPRARPNWKPESVGTTASEKRWRVDPQGWREKIQCRGAGDEHGTNEKAVLFPPILLPHEAGPREVRWLLQSLNCLSNKSI